jgi:uroporphyrin-III C-methyltransferase
MAGRVYLAGAGPGDPELLTLKALRVLQRADVILHDSLVGAAILELAGDDAVRIDVGKRCGQHSAPQAEINRLLVEYALAGKNVVRLKGGDPMIFGRAAEELQALQAHGIAYEIIPGVTAASAASASLGLSLTRRKIARSVHFLTGHGAEDGLPAHDWAALTRAGGTLVIYMGKETLPGLVAHLIEAGMGPFTPAIAVENATLPNERTTRATLSTLARALGEPGGPVVILTGEALREGIPAEIVKMAVVRFSRRVEVPNFERMIYGELRSDFGRAGDDGPNAAL